MGGSSCSDPDSHSVWHRNGTIGMFFMLKDQPTFIGAMSVFSMNSENPISQKVMTPSMQRGGIYPQDFIGFTTKSLYCGDSNSDISIATLQLPFHQNFIYNSIHTIGDIKGYADAKEREKVRKYGAGSGYTEGVVSSTTFTTTHGGTPEFPACILHNQILINPIEKGEFAVEGDAGAYVVNKDNEVVGMIIGFHEGYTYAMPSKCILKFLNES